MIANKPAASFPQPQIAGFEFYGIDLATLRYPEQGMTVNQLSDGSVILGLTDSA